MIKHIIFDFDGTIVNSIDVSHNIVNKFAQKYNFDELTKEDFKKLSELSLKDKIKKFKVPFYKIPKIAIEIMAEYKKHIDSIPIINNIDSTVKKLQSSGYILSILSSNSEANINNFLYKNNLLIFDNVISERKLFGKHLSIKKYIKTHNLNPQEVIYLGDEVRDIDACKKANINIIAVTWGFESKNLLEKSMPDFLAETPNDIVKIINKLNSPYE